MWLGFEKTLRSGWGGWSLGWSRSIGILTEFPSWVGGVAGYRGQGARSR